MKILNEMVTNICQNNNIKLQTFSKNWIYQLEKNNKIKYIIGYDFELNSSSVNLILKDKGAISEIFKASDIPHVEHKLFMPPIRSDYIGLDGNWNNIINFAEKHHYSLVCKDNYGSGGNDVFKINNQINLEKITQKMFMNDKYICLSPYYEIEEEYRAIYLDGIIKLIYKKERPYLIGDGINTIQQLLLKSNLKIDKNILSSLIEGNFDLQTILKKDEKVILNWKHNLGKGSSPIEIDDEKIKETINSIIQKVVKIIDINFASFDIIKVKNEFLILEVNAGIMMEKFAIKNENYYNKAYQIYEEAITKMFEK